MTVWLEIIPEAPEADDAVQIFVHGQVDDPATVLITGDGTLKTARSTVFTQGVQPDGTGPDAFELEVTGSPGTDFVLHVYEYGDDANSVETDPIYYHDDDAFTYPTSDDLIAALEAVMEDAAVQVIRGPEGVLTILFGGVMEGRKVELGADTGVTITSVSAPSGPYQWGPVVLPAGDYTVDVVDEDDESILDGDPIELEVE